MVVCGNALEVLRDWPEGCSNSDVVKFFTAEVKRLTQIYVLIRERAVSYLSWCARLVGEVAITCYLRPVLQPICLKGAELKDSVGRFFFDVKKGQDSCKNFCRLLVRCLITKKRPSLFATRFLFPIPSAKRFGNEFNCRLIDHADLNTGVIPRGFTILALIPLVLFDANVSFPIDNTRDVSNVCAFHYVITSLVWCV